MKQTPRVNYQLVLDETLKKIKDSGTRPGLLLHSCCAPCSSYVLEYLTQYFDITVFYYNPNISPESEYRHRVDEIQRLISEMCPQVGFIEGKYEPERFFEMAKRGARCLKCCRMRLEEAAIAARQSGSDYFTTTLSISPQKDSMVLNAIGKEISGLYGVPYLYSDFKKRGGYKRSTELSAKFSLYRQNYCGCVYSKAEAAMRNSAKKRLNSAKSKHIRGDSNAL